MSRAVIHKHAQTFDLEKHKLGTAPVIGRNKAGLDQFYTADHVVKQCLASLRLHRYDCIIEPSAGNGAFLNQIDSDLPTVAMDIQPRVAGIRRQDFLHYSPSPQHQKILVVGNPPFGIHHQLSDAFLQRALSFHNTQTVAFILPNTYNKHTRQKIIPPVYRIKTILNLGRNAFLYDGKPYHVPCSFFVFDKSPGTDLRFDPSQHQNPCDFTFGDKHNFDLFVFGANPAKFTQHPQPNNRGYFLRSKIVLPELCQRLQSVRWTGNSCASGGVAWLTKPELVMLYNNVHGLCQDHKRIGDSALQRSRQGAFNY